MTKPSKLRRLLRSRDSRSEFPHACVPFTRLYAHMKLATPASMAAAKGL
jgi:hypothetical protein